MTGFPLPSTGTLAGLVHSFAVRVYYEDTDLSGLVYHANYLRWFERARSDLLRLIGIDQRAAADARTGFFAVADLAIRYLRPARLDDAVLIETTTVEARAASCRLLQRAFRGTGMPDRTLLCEAQLRIGLVGVDARPHRLPEAWRAALAALVPVPEGS